jgi:hypothetical protein
MNRNLFLTFLLVVLMAAVGANAQGFGPGAGNGECQFIDEDGDGFNDLAPDADGDGIPNGQDPDWVKPEDGTGYQHQYGKLGETGGGPFGFGHVFAYAQAFAWKGANGVGQATGPGHAYGPGDGTGTAVGPNDGTGFGPGEGTGDCDGAGGVNAERKGRR